VRSLSLNWFGDSLDGNVLGGLASLFQQVALIAKFKIIRMPRQAGIDFIEIRFSHLRSATPSGLSPQLTEHESG
jgi:hypothetical protein